MTGFRTRACHLAALLSAAAVRQAFPAGDAGPLGDSYPAVDGSQRTRLFGPVIEWQDAADGARFHAVRPLFSATVGPGGTAARVDALWPLASFRRGPDGGSWRVLTVFGRRLPAPGGTNGWRALALPLAAAGRTAKGEAYAALFPLGGSVRDLTIVDRFDFVLWPLYHHIQQGESHTYSCLWPLYSRTTGPCVDRLRLFPFYGGSHNSRRDLHSRFVLWPLWTDRQARLPDGEHAGWMLWPLAGRLRAPDARTVMVLPPLFRFTARGESRSVHAPWPLVQWSNEPRASRLYLWPLAGTRTQGDETHGFLLWPLVHWSTEPDAAGCTVRRQVLPVFSRTTHRGSATNAAPDAARTALWPLFDHERTGSAARLRAPDLWPGRNPPAVERNLAPLTTLVEHTRQGAAAETRLLWGLFTHRRDAGCRETALGPVWRRSVSPGAGDWAVLGGLIGARHDDCGRRWRLLYCLEFGDDGKNHETP